MQSRLRSLVYAAVALCLFAGAPVSAQTPGSPFFDGFNGGSLGSGWTFTDHFAIAHPAQTTDHVTLSMTGNAVSMSFPGGVEHNQWLVEHAQITVPFLGGGAYETRMNTGVTGNQQFGLVFQGTEPGTFMMFMMYGNGIIHGYVERFSYVDGEQYRQTFFPVFEPQLTVPDAGPYYLRVTLDDEDQPTERIWRLEWSLDGINWILELEAVLEGVAAEENIGTITDVGLFVGNQPTDYSAFDGRYDYFEYTPFSQLPPRSPRNLLAVPDDGSVELFWGGVDAADEYRIYRDSGGGQSLLTTTVDRTFIDTNVTNGTEYTYLVTAVEAALESSPAVVVTTPRVPDAPIDPPEDMPVVGMLLWLDAEYALSDFGAGNPATLWRDRSGVGNDATASAAVAPIVVPAALHSRPVLNFDGIDDYLRLPMGFGDFRDGMTAFFVARPTELEPAFKLLALGNGAGNEMIVFGRQGDTGGLQYFTSDAAGNVGFFSTTDALVAGQVRLLTIRQAGGAVSTLTPATVSSDGEAIGTGNVYVPPALARSNNLIGKSYWPEGLFSGSLAEVILYDRELSGAEVSIVQAYLDQKYGLGIHPPVPLEPPANLTANAGDGFVSLAWNAVPGADGYLLARSEDGGATYPVAYDLAATGYVDNDVINEQPYTYVVAAYDSVSQSDDSTAVTATPSQVTLPELPANGLVLRLDAEQAEAEQGDGASVTSWADLSGSGNDATAPAGNAPRIVANAINGRAALYFDGLDDHFALPSGLEDFRAGVTLYVVARPTALQPDFKLVALGNGAGDDVIVLGRDGGSAGLQYVSSDEYGSVGWFSTDPTLAADEVGLFAVHQSGGAAGELVTATVRHGSELVGSGTAYVPPVVSRSGSLIGRGFWDDGLFEGELAEVLLYRRSLDDADRQAVEAYLDAKYSLGLGASQSAP